MWPIPVPKAAGCECCCAVGCESIGWRAHNSTPIFVSGDSLQVCPAALPDLFTLLGERCLPCRRVPDVDQTSAGGWVDVTSCFCRRLPEVAKSFAGDQGQVCSRPPPQVMGGRTDTGRAWH